jgi:hypothetical protein
MFVANASPTATGPRGRGRLVTLAAGLAFAAVSLAAGSAQAWTHRPSVERETRIFQGPLEVSVLVEGRTTPLFQASNKMDRWYLEARQGGKYEVRVRNTTGQRLAFVIAVDGLNAINGLRSHLGPDEPMYVLDPYQSTTVKGWRKDMGNVSRFVFVDEKRSYAVRTDQANGDLGWIRVAAFNEFRPIAYRPWGNIRNNYRDGGSGGGAGSDSRERAAAPEAKDESAAPREEMSRKSNGMGSDFYDAAPPSAQTAPSVPGTGWGRNERDRVRAVDFTPERFACTQVVLRYEYKQGLVALGILPWRSPVERVFERDNGQLGFAQPPKR